MVAIIERILSLLGNLATIACFMLEAAKMIQSEQEEGKESD